MVERVMGLSKSTEGKPRSLLSRVAGGRVLIFVGLMVFVALLAFAPLIQSGLNGAGGQNDEANPPVPVITSKSGVHEGLGFVVYATVCNEGGPGTVVVGAMVRYERFSGFGHSSFERSGAVYLGVDESRDVTLVFPEVLPVPCGNRHTIVWVVWARVA